MWIPRKANDSLPSVIESYQGFLPSLGRKEHLSILHGIKSLCRLQEMESSLAHLLARSTLW